MAGAAGATAESRGVVWGSARMLLGVSAAAAARFRARASAPHRAWLRHGVVCRYVALSRPSVHGLRRARCSSPARLCVVGATRKLTAAMATPTLTLALQASFGAVGFTVLLSVFIGAVFFNAPDTLVRLWSWVGGCFNAFIRAALPVVCGGWRMDGC